MHICVGRIALPLPVRSQSSSVCCKLLSSSFRIKHCIVTCEFHEFGGLILRYAFPGAIVGITCAILIALFLCQHKGTGRVGNWFAPVIGLWLTANLCINLYNIAKHHPGMFRCINPWYGLDYFIRNGKTAWVSLGGLVLCITGTEAMFADLGHFPRQAIQVSEVACAPRFKLERAEPPPQFLQALQIVLRR